MPPRCPEGDRLTEPYPQIVAGTVVCSESVEDERTRQRFTVDITETATSTMETVKKYIPVGGIVS
jgi:hypothetical protein